MIESFISLLKDDAEVSRLTLYLFLGYVILELIKFFLKPSVVVQKVIEKLVLIIAVEFLVLIIGNSIVNENYSRIWYLVGFFVVAFLRKKKIGKRYDDAVDKFADKISEKI